MAHHVQPDPGLLECDVPLVTTFRLASASTFEDAGDFVPLNLGGPDPHQVWTNMVPICPVVSPNAFSSIVGQTLMQPTRNSSRRRGTWKLGPQDRSASPWCARSD